MPDSTRIDLHTIQYIALSCWNACQFSFFLLLLFYSCEPIESTTSKDIQSICALVDDDVVEVVMQLHAALWGAQMHHCQRIGNLFIPVHGCPRLLPTSADPEAILAMNIDDERIVLHISEEHHAYKVKTIIFSLTADDPQESSKVAVITLSPFEHPRTLCD